MLTLAARSGPARRPRSPPARSPRHRSGPASPRTSSPAPALAASTSAPAARGFSRPVSFVESAARIPSKLNRKMITAAAVLSMSGTVRLWDSRYCMQIGARVTAAASTRWLFFLKPLHDPLTARTRPALSGSRIVSGARRCGSGHALPAVRYIVDEFPRKCRMVNQEAWEAG